jgi:uncharacterized alpha-E superfamily protein
MLSRVADSLYWMARYLERAEHTARILDVQLNLMLDEGEEHGGERWRRLLQSLDVSLEELEAPADAVRIAQFLTLDMESSASILGAITYARENAKQLREHISSEMWERLNRLYLDLRQESARDLWRQEPQEFCRRVIDGVSLFSGISLSTLNQGEAWHFLQVGRHLERTLNIAYAVDVHYQHFYKPQDTAGTSRDFMEWVGLLKGCAAFEAYCRVYTAEFSPEQIAEFLILNTEFPQAIGFGAITIHEELKKIEERGNHETSRLRRLTGKLQARLRYGQIEEMLPADLHGFLGEVIEQGGLIHQAVYQSYISYPIESAMATT